MLGGIYRHYKTSSIFPNGRLYKVIKEVRHADTLEKHVVYRAMYNCPTFGHSEEWVRSTKSFLEPLEINSYRFTLVCEQ